MIDTTPSYRCKVSNTHGSLHLGFRRYKVEVQEMSRDSFSVQVPPALAKKVVVGSKYRLLYQEMLWSVRCTHKWIGPTGQMDVDFQQIEELTPPKMQTGPSTGLAKQVDAIGQTDPTLPVAMLGAFVVAVLVLPAWGGRWGTSEIFCSAISSTWSALSELVTGKR